LESALEDPPAARRFIVRMDTEVDNLTFLVNELLELSRIEAGRVNFEFQRIHPCDLMIKPYERMLLPAERAGLSMSLECSRDLPLVFADPDRIAQVFINMLHNAIKFTPPGGRISLGSWIHENMVVFMVRDTGEGIPQKDLKRIFERFYKVDRARSGGGTGLGLSICKHMVEAHGGYLWAESEEGRGSSLFFTIPIASG
jgi:two-component system phosphate regulon sensor histidine kinase PhoR